MTLHEVEAISKQKIVSAHVGREAPRVDNPTWKAGKDENAINASPLQDERSPPDISEATIEEPEPITTYIGHQIPEDFLKKAGLLHEDGERECELRPVYKLNADGSLPREQFRIQTSSRVNLIKYRFFLLLQKHQTKCLMHFACSVTRNSVVAKRRL